MKISELIKELRQVQKEKGDIEVMFYFYGHEKRLTRYNIDYDKNDNKLYLG